MKMEKTLKFALVMLFMMSLCACGNKEVETETEYTIGVVNIETLKVRGEPDGDSRTVMLLPNGAEVTILAEENGFYRISLQPEDDTAEGYVRKEYLDVE